MVSYYNPVALQRQQQALAAGHQGGQFHHGSAAHHMQWYPPAPHGAYTPHPHQMTAGSGTPASYCMQGEHQQMWHHHSVFHPGGGEYITPDGAAAMHHQQHPTATTPVGHPMDGVDGHQLPSPPITVSGSDMSSPGGGGSGSPGVGHHQGRPTPTRSPYEWIKKTAYQNQPTPGKFGFVVLFNSPGKRRPKNGE